MLFNSYIFIFGFMPLCLAGFMLAAKHKPALTIWVLTAASLIFYGWGEPWLIGLIGVSTAFNFGAGRLIVWSRRRKAGHVGVLLAVAVAANLILLGYYKYFLFFLSTIGFLQGHGWTSFSLVVPLGISFFTFTQVAFLVDAARGEAQEYDYLRYLLFVTYFPHLIAGPIIHHKEMMPQFLRLGHKVNVGNAAVAMGITIFSIGLFKKLALADTVAPVADTFFSIAETGALVSMAEAWIGTLAYTFQIYFDFSGYCDMAIGLSLLFGIRLPANFDSPYKAVSIIEFWRRWHMTLSRFLRDYLYIPLGGNRRGPVRRHVNILLTMFLGGLWHGANWTFVAWGCLHGLFLVVNHLWRSAGMRLHPALGWALTFGCVTVAWVFFRADSLASAMHVVSALFSLDGLPLDLKASSPNELVGSRLTTSLAGACLLALVIFAPNAQQLMTRFRPVLDEIAVMDLPGALRWRPIAIWGVIAGAFFTSGIVLLGGDSPFLYFQF